MKWIDFSIGIYGPARWRYLHLGFHDCLTRRGDELNAYLWIALGPFDVKLNYRPSNAAERNAPTCRIT